MNDAAIRAASRISSSPCIGGLPPGTACSWGGDSSVASMRTASHQTGFLHWLSCRQPRWSENPRICPKRAAAVVLAGLAAFTIAACGASGAPPFHRVSHDVFGLIGDCGAGPHISTPTALTNDLVHLARSYSLTAPIEPRPLPAFKNLRVVLQMAANAACPASNQARLQAIAR